ncbi:MAG: 2-oxo acid dehydrogenase subunit E2 [Clostridiaceae bacterium]|nr:2-oxo acid dehydrogenase subunit E2 [Oscillospiraceae bacterium]NLO61818.1 2-oxo acid dehydrogenase subunit E2 [Clostridiaceae bacterium]
MKRHDGRILKSLGPFEKLYPYIIGRRSDAQVFSKQIIRTDGIDDYIHKKRADGTQISYLHVFIAAYLRGIAQRPNVNRFVMNGKLYARKGISFSMVVKPELRDNGSEVTVKFTFTGHESIDEVTEIINRTIEEARHAPSETNTGKLVSFILSMPGIFKKFLVSTFKWMDRHNLLPKSVIDASPFHATMFLTYLKSIRTDYVYHHPYNVGTAGIFAALGKTEMLPVVENGQVVVRKCCTVGYSLDDRICDGLYIANSFSLAKKYFLDPSLLENRLEEITEDII